MGAPPHDGRGISRENWAQIRRLHPSERVSKARTPRDPGISRNTARRRWDRREYSRAPVVTTFEPFEQQVRQLLGDAPSMPATVLAQRVGWSGSATWFRQHVAAMRPDHDPSDPADRIVHHPGDQVQCDLWLPKPRIPIADGTQVMLPVLVVVASRSPFITALMIGSSTTVDLLAGRWALLSGQLGVVPRRLMGDHETGIGRRNRLAAGVGEFIAAPTTRTHQLTAHDPESEGRVERVNGDVETSFRPARVAAVGTTCRTGLPEPTAARALRPGPRQRLLRAPGCDRRDGRGRRRPQAGSASATRSVSSPSTHAPGAPQRPSPHPTGTPPGGSAGAKRNRLVRHWW